ncbi:methyltransferase domain-containing protein [Acetivibrio cellulolyticus]|uniref:methyltransferase domain-containing protein n=1 Tax=Acetivibrio cellulolyticus TaxID=35830 RepID=UPI0001E2D119|nr:methyltransferase domain-containing protein [Acetivibrio cellulolyticus]
MLNEIQSRYSKERDNSCNLSCGNNLDFLKISPGENILDLGCGRGNETIQAAIQTGPHGKAIGLDITQEMIDVALSNAEGIGISNIWFVKGDIENLPFDERIFDAVISNCVINHAKSKIKVYSEIFRVLKTGGRFVISDAVTKYPLPSEIKNDPEAWAQCFGGAVTEIEYLDSITSSGFKNIEILKRREYIKNGYDFISLTIMATKQGFESCFECWF